MQFRAEFFPKVSAAKMNHQQNIMLIGSCFTGEMGNKLAAHKFNVLQNPHGILFNPVSIGKALSHYATEKTYTHNDLFLYQELYGSWHHHTKFSHPEANVALSQMNMERTRATLFLRNADWLIVTLGSAFVYEVGEGFGNHQGVVANCHKVPADKFQKRLLGVAETISILQEMIQTVRSIRKDIRVIFTVSPVRHLREGFIENNRSKAVLIQAVHALVDNETIQYFPSYELVMDDLRDYRFYAEDLVHPNYAATQYVWEKLIPVYMTDDTVSIMKEIASIKLAVQHKPFNPSSKQHQLFLDNFLNKTYMLQQAHPYISLNEEIQFLKDQLSLYHHRVD